MMMLKNIHPLSFGLGIATGLIVVVVTGFSLRSSGGAAVTGRTGGQNIARMAQRLSMTEADLQKEIDSGKTMQQIAQEHGVTFGGGRGGNGSSLSGTGATASSASLSSSMSSVSSTSSMTQ